MLQTETGLGRRDLLSMAALIRMDFLLMNKVVKAC